jgi:catechol 2,3-dioxygenase-like lactoylglutathione lyase family enzyme
MTDPVARSGPRRSTPALSRRAALGTMAAAALTPWIRPAWAEGDAAEARVQLPLNTTGLEHLGTVVPDVAAAGKFYGRLLNPELYKEKDPPLRYYVTLGTGYLALGSRPGATHAFFDHFCALVRDYDAAAMKRELQAQGLPAGRYGIIPDPDGIGLQLLGAPGGLAKTTVPAGRIVEADALVRPRRLDHVVLHVADLDKSLQFYRKFFGKEASRGGHPDQASFQVAQTRLVLEASASGEPPRVHRVGIDVERFDGAAVGRELEKLGAHLERSPRGTLRFTDPNGLGIELASA